MNKKTIILLLNILLCISGQAQKVIKLTEMDLSKAYQEYGGIMIGKSVTNEPASILGNIYDDVIGIHAMNIIKINLHGHATRFQAQIGISDSNIDYSNKDLVLYPLVNGTKIYYKIEKNAKTFAGLAGTNGKVEKGSVHFIIKGDDKELYNSGLIKQGDTPKLVDIPLQGIKLLKLIVEPTEDGPSGDHAVWIQPQITFSGITPTIMGTEIEGEGPKMNIQTEKKILQKIKTLPVMQFPLKKHHLIG